MRALTILMRALTVASVALLAASCGGAAGVPPVTPVTVDMHERLDVGDLPAVDVRVRIQLEHRRDAERCLRAAVATLRTCEGWFGPFPHPTLTIVDPAWRATPTVTDVTADAVVMLRTPWWTTRTAMAPEIATARAVSRRGWSEALAGSALPASFVDALVEYTARRAVAPLFAQENNSPGYRFVEERYFGGFVPRFVRLRRLAETDDATTPILALGTLERWLGQPVFDQILTEFVRASRGRAPAMADFERAASEVSGQNLTWFFDQLRSGSVLDYGVERLASERQNDGSYQTTVVARRYGEGLFTGASAPRAGPFDSGRGVALRVTFADGSGTTDHWDGRDRERVFWYRSPAAAISAEIDPDRVILLDVNRTNNSRTLTPHGAAVATRWAGRWMIWMQSLMLTYASLV
jgi:hypothetical protein